MVVQYRIPRNLLEVYKTDEENFVPYTPMGSTNTADETETTEEEGEETTTTEEETTEDKEGFTLHQGEILETYYYGGFFDVECESDYEDINNSGSISLPSVDKDRFYKGVRVLFRKGWENIGEHVDPLKLDEVLLGFITEQTYNEDSVELKLSGMTKLLEQEYKFNFTQMKISQILEEMIKTAGLVPKVDPTGLDDMVIDYTNISSDGDEGVSGDGSMTEDEAWDIASSWSYGGIGTQHDPEKAWQMLGTKKGGSADCFDATAWLYYVYNFKIGIPARDICYASSTASSGTHHTIQIKKNGKWIDPPQYSQVTSLLGVIKSRPSQHICREPPSGGSIPAWSDCPYLR